MVGKEVVGTGWDETVGMGWWDDGDEMADGDWWDGMVGMGMVGTGWRDGDRGDRIMGVVGMRWWNEDREMEWNGEDWNGEDWVGQGGLGGRMGTGWDKGDGMVGWGHRVGLWGLDGGSKDGRDCGGDGGEGVSRDGDSAVETLGWGQSFGAGGAGWAGPRWWGCPVVAPWALNPAAPAQALQRAMLDATADTAAVVQEAVSSIETVRTFAGEEEEERRHGRALAKTLGLRDQIDVERALYTLVWRVRWAQGGPRCPGTPVPPPQPADPRACRRCSWPCRCWSSATDTRSSARGPSPPAASSPSSSTRRKSAATCR